jgi:fructoselysine 6-phosphate deglycase
MLMQTIVEAGLEQREKWPLLPKLLSSFRELPKVIASTQHDETARAKEVAETFKPENQIYLVVADPEETTAFVTGTCILTEILYVHDPPIKTSAFFHGFLEVVTPELPMILLLEKIAVNL